MTTDGSAYLHPSWGSFTTVGNIPDGTVFQIKAGTTYTSSLGGYIYLKDFYKSGYTNVTFQSGASWGVGDHATFDFSGCTNSGLGMFLTQIEGMRLINLNFLNAPWDGVYCKEYGSGLPTPNLYFANLNFTNCGCYLTNRTSDVGASEGDLNVRFSQNVTVTNCSFAGNSNCMNGLVFGDLHMPVTDALVVNCESFGHWGNPALGAGLDDIGIGFRALDSTVTYSNCFSHDNQKGFDLGSHGDSNYSGYIVMNSTSSDNWGWGINMVGQGGASQGPYPYPTNSYNYQINNLIISNGVAGSRVYGSCQYIHLIHNVYERNGWNTTDGGSDTSHISINPDDLDGKGPLVAHVYNNLFGNGLGSYLYVDRVNSDTNQFTLDMDSNSYQQGTERQFSVWNEYGEAGQPTAYFSYGTNGPGHASGNWYSWYRWDATPPPRGGAGHLNCDAHSKGTGCGDQTPPPLDANYMPTNSFSGVNLSTMPWYTPKMAYDRDGVQRISWTIGAHEFVPMIRYFPPLNLRVVAH